MLSGQPIITVGQCSDAGRKSRNDNSYGVLVPVGAQLVAKGIAMAIADGMSSSEGAKAASETCVKNFLEDYYATPKSWSVKKSVATVLKALNNWLHSQGQAIHQSESEWSVRSPVLFSNLALRTFFTQATPAFHSCAMAASNHLRGTTR